MTKTDTPKQARIEVFRSGTFTPMQGSPVSYSADDLAGIVANYDPDGSPALVVVGHPKTDAPAYGWVKGFEYDTGADRLYADIGDLEASFAEAVKEGRYKKVSMAFFKPDAPNNPSPGNWYAKHIGFLGAAAPAVSGLTPVSFAHDEGEVVTFIASFGERGFEEAASVRNEAHTSFAEKLVKEGRLLPVPMDKVVSLLDALPADKAGDMFAGLAIGITHTVASGTVNKGDLLISAANGGVRKATADPANPFARALSSAAGVASRSMATDASCYADNNKVAFSGTDRWDDPISDPSADIDEAKEIVRRMIGRYPNKLALSAGAFKALKRHPKIKEQFKYTSSDSITPEMLASYFDIATVVVGKAVYLPTNAGEDELAQDVWANDDSDLRCTVL